MSFFVITVICLLFCAITVNTIFAARRYRNKRAEWLIWMVIFAALVMMLIHVALR